MNYHDDDLSEFEDAIETGSDELLSDDNLRLPESASVLVRLHAIRSWLARRQRETNLELGEAAWALQELMREEPQESRLRRRERLQSSRMQQSQQLQQTILLARERLRAYEEAEELLEECLTHTTLGERSLVEYYLSLENLMTNHAQDSDLEQQLSVPWNTAMADVLRRVEHVGIPQPD